MTSKQRAEIVALVKELDDKHDIFYSVKRIASAITPNCIGSNDASGSHVESLTEAVMGTTAGLMAIAEAIGELAAAVRNHDDGGLADWKRNSTKEVK
jgi:hypothetical protein